MIFPQHTSHEFFYRSCDFHFNILCSFEVIAKTRSVALEVSLSICTCIRNDLGRNSC